MDRNLLRVSFALVKSFSYISGRGVGEMVVITVCPSCDIGAGVSNSRLLISLAACESTDIRFWIASRDEDEDDIGSAVDVAFSNAEVALGALSLLRSLTKLSIFSSSFATRLLQKELVRG